MADEHPPPNGWQTPRPDPSDLDAIGQVLRGLLEAVPRELQARFVQAVQALLEAIRALIEWWIAALERRGAPGPPPEVRDIPVR